MRRAFTLLELMLVLVIATILIGVTVPRITALRDHASVAAAVMDIRESIETGRYAAIMRVERTQVEFDPAQGIVRVVSPTDTVLQRNLAQTHGVWITATNRTITFTAGGVGWGASNTSIAVHRGAFADTVVVSRVGRVRS